MVVFFKCLVISGCFLILMLGAISCDSSSEVITVKEVLWARHDYSMSKNFDVVFIHPTTLMDADSCYNDDLQDVVVNERTLRSIQRQASVFNDSCRVFAPFYRQMSMGCLSLKNSDISSLEDIAYADVSAALDEYFETYNQGRPFFLASHSQGTMLLKRYLCENASTINSQLLVAIYAIGYTITDQDLDKMQIPLSQNKSDQGVLITWNTIGEGGVSPVIYSGALCINPLSWNSDRGLVNKSYHCGAHVVWEDGVGNYLHFCSAEVTDRGALLVRDVPDDVLKQLDMSLGADVYHLYDYDFFYENLIENIALRCDTYYHLH